MRPALVFPYNDPDGTMLPRLRHILQDLKEHFDHAYLCSPPATLSLLRQNDPLLTDDFFTLYPVDGNAPVGERFHLLYRRAAIEAPPEQALHLCYLDRLSFALQGTHRDSFLADIDSLTPADLPLIFQRSQYAWETHPQNYRQLEAIVTNVGKNLFGRELDYGWCHIVVPAKQLCEVMPQVKNPDLSMVAEMIFYMHDTLHTREVDWLAWEDPFILNRDAHELKAERERSLEETNKRLRYVLPMLETLTRLSMNGRQYGDQPQKHSKWIEWAREIFSLSQAGLTYGRNEFDIARYKRLQEIAAEMIESRSELSKEKILQSFSLQAGYATPKIDVRGAVVHEGKILLIQERTDGKWAMPGGWADLGDTPASVAEREVWEESGYRVKAEKLIAVLDANRIQPMEFYHAFKIIFLCRLIDGEPRPSNETLAVNFFELNDLPPLSGFRTNQAMLQEVFAHVKDPHRPAAFD
jgi:ADP-ribose pyrophosphatase YjhB (NUDIX family)